LFLGHGEAEHQGKEAYDKVASPHDRQERETHLFQLGPPSS
jgi:hypothetical protein